ncbi:MAG TPA: hypothetical protein VLV31_10585 [Candidatus Acidoferrales bacterium]|nr:hypothetical protein [Candidatus Acidoferrales bacterium]
MPRDETITDEDVEEIMNMQAPRALAKEFEAMVKDKPLLTAGLIFAFGLLLGASLSGHRRRR